MPRRVPAERLGWAKLSLWSAFGTATGRTRFRVSKLFVSLKRYSMFTVCRFHLLSVDIRRRKVCKDVRAKRKYTAPQAPISWHSTSFITIFTLENRHLEGHFSKFSPLRLALINYLMQYNSHDYIHYFGLLKDTHWWSCDRWVVVHKLSKESFVLRDQKLSLSTTGRMLITNLTSTTLSAPNISFGPQSQAGRKGMPVASAPSAGPEHTFFFV